MRDLEEMIETGALEGLPKKERLRLEREHAKLARNLSGIRDLDRPPDAVFILDTKKEEIAVREARKLGIPVIAVLDTNCDPDDVDYAIPGNDDAIRAGALLARVIADAVIEGKSMRPDGGDKQDADTAAGRRETEILPGAAAQPKAEWELQLEAEEATEAEPSGAEPPGDAAPTPAGADTGAGTSPAQPDVPATESV
jgi:small subunit ribosomal protein S2